LGEVNKNNRGIKEGKIVQCLAKLSDITGLAKPVHDKIVKDGCSKRRPDFYYQDFSDLFHLIVEVDENQHSRYSCSIEGELRRMITLYEEDSGGFPLIFIRFNPDPYYYKNKIVKTYSGREKQLSQLIIGLSNRKELLQGINVIYLYYDNFECVKIESFDYEINDGMINVKHKHPLHSNNEHSFTI